MADPTKKDLIAEVDLRQLEDMSFKGASMKDMAAVLGINVRTLQRRVKDQPGVAVAIRKGRAEANNKVSNKILQKALGIEDDGNTDLLKYWDRTRGGWDQGTAETVDEDEYIPRESLAKNEKKSGSD